MHTSINPRSTAPRPTAREAGAAARPDALTRVLLTGGVAAGPVFVVTVAVQALTREGFDLTRHPLSLLAVGEGGWVQTANFLLAGVLSLGFAVGVGRRLRSGAGHLAGPWLLGVFGIGLVIGGLFTADPGMGFPEGAPEGIPDTLSAHGMIHAVAPPLAFLALIAACIVFARRFAREGRRGAAAWSIAAAIGCLVLTAPVGPGTSVRLFLGIALAFAWVSWLGVSLLRRG
jgi:hypothetical membrane protein